MTTPRILIVNSKETYAPKLQKLRESCAATGLTLDLWDAEDKSGLVAHAQQQGYDALLHRNEHGRLFADGAIPWIREALTQKLPVLSTDFGYLDHYSTVSFDFYRAELGTPLELSSGIHTCWHDLPTEVDWKAAPKYIREFRTDVLRRIATADGSGYWGKVCIWMQWGTSLLRPELGTLKQWEWVNLLCAKVRALGLEPVVKLGIVDHSDIYERTVPRIDPGITLVTDRRSVAESNPRAAYDKNANWNLLAGCSYHIILCSSVSHLMVLAERPVIATGQSWFNALNVFQENVTWDPPLVRPQVDAAARARWVNWWLQSQSPWKDASPTLLRVLERATAYHQESHA